MEHFVFALYPYSQEDSNKHDKLGCGEIMDPCNGNEPCCGPLICYGGRCITAQGKGGICKSRVEHLGKFSANDMKVLTNILNILLILIYHKYFLSTLFIYIKFKN